MRIKGFIVFVLLVLGFSLTKAQTNTFEGMVKYDAKFVDEQAEASLNMTMDYYIKNNKFRVEINSPEGQTVMLIDKDKSVMLMPQNNMYMEFGQPDPEDIKAPDAKDDITKAKTGQKKEILGFMCEQYILKENDETIELWATKELGLFMFAASPMEKSKIDNKYFEGGFFPLIINMKGVSGNETGSLIAVKVEKKTIDNSMFEIPSGYTKFSMPNMQFPTGK